MSTRTVSIEDICRKYNIDMGHARHVASASLALFDAVPEVHGLAAERRGLVELAAILHNIAYASDPTHHHTAGRDLILSETLDGVSEEERLILACTTAFHRKKVRPRKEPVFQNLPKKIRKETLAIAAILRVGDAFDYSESQSSRIEAITAHDGKVIVVVGGPRAEEEAARGNVKADLWNETFETPIAVIDESTAAEMRMLDSARRGRQGGLAESPPRHGGGRKTVSAKRAGYKPDSDRRGDVGEKPTQRLRGYEPDSQNAAPGVKSGDPIALAGCKVLQFYYQCILLHETVARDSHDDEAIHQTRVATRRLRAAIRLFGPWLPRKTIRRILKHIREMTRVLGPVRDFDVLIDQTRKYRKSLAAEDRKALDPLLKQWRKERTDRRKEMSRFLESREHADFGRLFKNLPSETSRILEAAAAKDRRGKPCADLIRHVVPAMVWQHYQSVRAYECVLKDPPLETLHSLRIECKRLRYALELLSEVLGLSVEKIISELKGVQDHLGQLHDLDVTIGLLREFLISGKHEVASGRSKTARGIADYLAHCERRLNENRAAFPAIWNRLTHYDFRHLLAEATAAP